MWVAQLWRTSQVWGRNWKTKGIELLETWETSGVISWGTQRVIVLSSFLTQCTILVRASVVLWFIWSFHVHHVSISARWTLGCCIYHVLNKQGGSILLPPILINKFKKALDWFEGLVINKKWNLIVLC